MVKYRKAVVCPYCGEFVVQEGYTADFTSNEMIVCLNNFSQEGSIAKIVGRKYIREIMSKFILPGCLHRWVRRLRLRDVIGICLLTSLLNF